MRIVFSRHGNTFAPGDRVVWVGSETDLPLVASGVAQAEAAAKALRRTGLVPSVIYSATLRRTRGYADIVVANLGGGIEIVEDTRLNEVNYGPWAGRTSEEIERELGQGEALAAWSQHDRWPEDAGWPTRRDALFAGITSFAEDLRRRHGGSGLKAPVMVVSSNGTLRFFARLADPVCAKVEPPASFQMKTGHLGLMTEVDGDFCLERWNVTPEAL
ncbi:MAG: histidine phosphatase family protein [Alphaproteobacteria bacterium]